MHKSVSRKDLRRVLGLKYHGGDDHEQQGARDQRAIEELDAEQAYTVDLLVQRLVIQCKLSSRRLEDEGTKKARLVHYNFKTFCHFMQ